MCIKKSLPPPFSPQRRAINRVQPIVDYDGRSGPHFASSYVDFPAVTLWLLLVTSTLLLKVLTRVLVPGRISFLPRRLLTKVNS